MKEKAIKILKITQIGVAILLFCLIFFGVSDTESGIILPNSIFYLPIAVYAIFVALFIGEFVLKRANIRALIYFIEIVLTLGFVIQKDQILALTTLMIAGLPNAIITVVAYIKDFNENTNIKPLPLGFYSEFHFYAVCGSISLMIGALIILYFIFETNKINFGFLFIAVPVILIIMLFVMIKFNPLVKAFSSINKELNYEKYSKELDELVPNNLHPESRAFLEVARANYMLLDNKEEALKYFDTASTVTSRQYIIQYAIIKTNFASMKHNRKEFENALALINAYGGKNSLKLLAGANAAWEINNSKELIPDAEEIYNINAPLPVQKIINKHSLMIYYDTREIKEKALELANELKDCPFNQYKNDALKIIEGANNEK